MGFKGNFDDIYGDQQHYSFAFSGSTLSEITDIHHISHFLKENFEVFRASQSFIKVLVRASQVS